MTATLPQAVQEVFARFVTTELTTIDSGGRPITWPVTPYYSPGAATIDVTTGLGWPKKARDAAANPKVALLFSDATGSGIERAPMVLVQGVAEVSDRDLDANRERWVREHAEKLPERPGGPPSPTVQRRHDWYYARIYMHVRPERVYVWGDGDVEREPVLLRTHTEEVRSGHDEEAESDALPLAGGRGRWDRRLVELGRRYPTAVLTLVAPDGFPFSMRVPIWALRRGRAIRVDASPVGAPLRPGPVCLTAHDHDEALRWQRNFQVRGDLVEDASGGWVVIPQRVVHGFELPPVGPVTRAISNFTRIRRYRRLARRERGRLGGSPPGR